MIGHPMSGDALRALVALAKDPVMQKLRRYHIGWDDFAQQAFEYFRDLPALTAPDAGREALEQSIDAALLQHGSYRNAAKALGFDHVYLHRLRNGAKDKPSPAVLAALGLTRNVTVTYRAARPQEDEG